MAIPPPDQDEPDDAVVEVRPSVCAVFILLFLALITVPPLIRNITTALQGEWTPVREIFRWPSPDAENLLLRKKQADPRITRMTPGFIEHREAWEDRLSEAEFVRVIRRELQGTLTTGLGEGNRKTIIAADGWFYFRPALDALTGYGPLLAEPDSVARDPTRLPWTPPEPVILDFHQKLAAAGVELILLPIPVKPMIVPEHLAGMPVPEAPITHPDADDFYARLQAQGVQILDLKDPMFALRGEDEVFLRRDTHWTPAAMELAAREVAALIRERPWFQEIDADPGRYTTEPAQVSADGDLLGNLELAAPERAYPRQTVTIHQVAGPGGNPAQVTDKSSPIVLLGDSFTNIYHDASMGWGENAGFAEHLVKELGTPIDTIARNGQAATGVRREFAGRPGASEMLKQKRVVIWAVAARDLFLSETTARETNVEWRTVDFNEQGAWRPAGETPEAQTLTKVPMTEDDPAPGEGVAPLVVEAELIARAPLPDPSRVNYPDSLLELKFRVANTVRGEYEGEEILVITWGFQKKQLSAASSWRTGETLTLHLVPFDQKADLQGMARAGLDEFLLDPWWVEKTE